MGARLQERPLSTRQANAILLPASFVAASHDMLKTPPCDRTRLRCHLALVAQTHHACIVSCTSPLRRTP
jgi:hypothetical protein